MNVERLKHAIEVLEKVDPAQFRMDVWFTNLPAKRCDSYGCAAGWCAVDPQFKTEGLRLQGITTPQPAFGHFTGYQALGEFFDLNDGNTHYLFDPDYYPAAVAYRGITPQQVIIRIQWLLSEGELL